MNFYDILEKYEERERKQIQKLILKEELRKKRLQQDQEEIEQDQQEQYELNKKQLTSEQIQELKRKKRLSDIKDQQIESLKVASINRRKIQSLGHLVSKFIPNINLDKKDIRKMYTKFSSLVSKTIPLTKKQLYSFSANIPLIYSLKDYPQDLKIGFKKNRSIKDFSKMEFLDFDLTETIILDFNLYYFYPINLTYEPLLITKTYIFNEPLEDIPNATFYSYFSLNDKNYIIYKSFQKYYLKEIK